MTSFPNTDGPSGRLRRDGGGGLPGVGIDRSLISPGRSFSVSTGGAAKLEQISNLLDAFTGAAGTAIEVNAREAARQAQSDARMLDENARVAAELERNQDAVVKQTRGLGERDARAKLPLLQQEIANDKLQIPPGADPVEFTREFLGKEFDGIDPQYQDAAVALIENDVVKAFSDRKDALAKVAVKDTHNLLGEYAIGKSAAEVQATIGEAMRFPGSQDVPEQEIRARVVGPDLEVAAREGNVDRVREIGPLLGDDSRAAQLLEQAATNQKQAQTARFEATADSFRTRLYGNESTATIRKDLDKAVASGSIDAGVALSLQGTLDSRDKEREQQAARLKVLADTKAFEASTLSSDLASAQAARTTGGLARITGDAVARIPDPTELSGFKEVKITAQERKDNVRDAALAQIDRTSPSPEIALARKVEFAATNNAPIPDWTSTLSAGISAGYGAVASSPDGKVEVPANLIDGYHLYKNLAAIGIGPKNMHMDQATSLFYERARFAEKYIRPGNEQEALAFVLQIKNESPFGTSLSVDDRKAKNVIGDIPDARNGGEAKARIESIAKYLMATGGNEEDAVKQAVKHFRETHTRIRDTWLYTGDKHLPDDIAFVADVAAKRYAETFGTPKSHDTRNIVQKVAGIGDPLKGFGKDGREDLRASDLYLAPGSTESEFVLYDRKTGLPVENADAMYPNSKNNLKYGRFTAADLLVMSQELGAYRATEAGRKALEDLIAADADARAAKNNIPSSTALRFGGSPF